MKSNGIDTGRAHGLMENSLVGQANGQMGMHQMPSETNTFISVWKTNASVAATKTVQLPLISAGTYSFFVDWGDGKIDFIKAYNDAKSTHAYQVAGTYTIKITGTIIGWQFISFTSEQPKLLSIIRWGCLRFYNSGGEDRTFYNCVNLTCKDAVDAPNLSPNGGNNVMSNLFYGCNNLQINLSMSWNLWPAVGLYYTFYACSNFNSPIGNWNTSNLGGLQYAFGGASKFNQDISAWDTSNMTDMQYAFSSASTFNQPLNSWDVSRVLNFRNMFSYSAFNQDISNWNVSAATSMQQMFFQAFSFNQPLANWERVGSTLANVTNMAGMFYSTSFDQDISNWNMSGTTDINSMFASTSFNQPLANWERVGSTLANVTNINSIFSNNNTFNQDISTWNVSSVTSMYSMFTGAAAFDQNIGGWNVSQVNDMSYMFYNAYAFNRNIGSWNVSSVANFTSFMFGKSSANFSTANMDAIYNGWVVRELKPSLIISFGTINRTSASAESRALLNRGAYSTKSATNFTNSGGLVKITTSSAHGLSTNNKVFIKGVLPSYVNGLWSITYVSTTEFTLQGSTYGAAFSSAGTVITSYGWTITEGIQV